MEQTNKWQVHAARLWRLRTPEDFTALALELFRLHFRHNPVYRDYVSRVFPSLREADVTHESQIPFLPIELFKSHKVLLEGCEAADYFASSGTTGSRTSRHWLVEPRLYEESCVHGFEYAFGPVADYTFLALLPNYLEQQHSSLVHMMRTFMAHSPSPYHGFYLNETDRLADVLRRTEAEGRKVLLMGVTFALLDLAEKGWPGFPLRHVRVMETGGMKGRRKEIVREELHAVLGQAFGLPHIYSEYGMCELFSQAYLHEDGWFVCPPWMRVRLRSVYDPLRAAGAGESGGIDVIDLANLYSCPFIATQDLGRQRPDGRFTVLGRFDGSDIRGCNLMVQ